MKIVIGWLKKEYTFLIGMLLMGCLFAVCTYLMDANPRPMLLTLQVCGFCFLVWSLISFYFYWKKHRLLIKTQREMEHSIESLPEASDLNEELYWQMLTELYEKCERLEQKYKSRTSEEKDYYTLWVHQIKTPIAAMRLILQNMEDQSKTASLSRELSRVELYAKMALQYARLQEIGTDLEIKKCDVYKIMKQVIKQFKTEFIEKKLSIQFETFHCVIATDEKWLAFVLEQILSNAVKYTVHGGITITCSQDELSYTISIQDTGIGIRAEDLPRIYEKGYTGFNGHMDQRSTGIGLYLCKKTADMLGMTIYTESEVQKGTTVSLVIKQ